MGNLSKSKFHEVSVVDARQRTIEFFGQHLRP